MSNDNMIGKTEFTSYYPVYPIYPTQTNPQYQSKPYCCPICTGSGIVSKGFYNRTGNTWTNDGGTEQCRSCNGTGIVWG